MMYFSVFTLGILLGMVIQNKFRDIKDQNKKYNNRRQDDGC